jgi:hypothetical protein
MSIFDRRLLKRFDVIVMIREISLEKIPFFVYTAGEKHSLISTDFLHI